MRERGLKFNVAFTAFFYGNGRSREGAWIEIIVFAIAHIKRGVAPVRERGLK